MWPARTPLFIWGGSLAPPRTGLDVGFVYLDGLLSVAGVEGAGDGVAARGLTVGGGAGAAPVVVGEEVGAVAVVEIGLVKANTSITTTIAAMAATIQGRIVASLLSCSRLSRRSSSVWRAGSVSGSVGL
jgi:hypothetical protein